MDTSTLTKSELRSVEVARAHLLIGNVGAAARVLSAAVRASRNNGQRLAEIGWSLGLISSPDWSGWA